MKVKELERKFKKDYAIIYFGENKTWKTLKQCMKNVSPWSYTHFTTNKEFNNREVIEYVVDNTPKDEMCFKLADLKFTGIKHIKGTVYALVTKN